MSPAIYQHSVLKALICVFLVLAANYASASVIRDTEIEDALLKVMRPMAADAGLNPDTMRVRVVIDPRYNAYVTSDNMIYVHSGIFTSSDTMQEVAGVLAHEIGHIAAGHIPRRSEAVGDAQQAGIFAAIAAVALTAAGSGDAAVGVLAGGIDRTRRIVLARSRQDESVADDIAIRLMSNQELSVAPLAKAMRRIGAERSLPESRQSDYYLSHPGALERSAVFQDHVNNNESPDMMEPAWMIRTHARIKTKLEAWTDPASSVLSTNIGDTSDDATYKRAIAFHRLSDYEAAAAEMSHLVGRYPGDPYYHEFLGDIFLKDGRIDKAIASYKTALALMEDGLNKGQINLSLGRALMIRGDPASLDEAVKILEKANRDEPEWAFAKRQLGVAYGRAGRLADADLALAEEALMVGNHDLAKQLAGRVAGHTDATAVHKRLAQDILNEIDL
jgi:predicted Zn-dependent protease